MEQVIVEISDVQQKGSWNFEPYSQAITDVTAKLKRSIYPVRNLGELVMGNAVRGFSVTASATEEGIPILSGRNLSSEGVDFTNVRYISPEEHKKLERTQVKTGDVLVSLIIRHPPIAAVYKRTDPANLTSHLVRMVTRDELHPEYLAYYLNSETGLTLLRSITTGSTLPTLTVGALMNLPIILPPLSEQKRIVEVVERLTKEASAMEATAQGHRAEAQSLLNHLFGGAQ